MAGVRAQMASFLEKYGGTEDNAASYAYVALLKAYRSMVCIGCLHVRPHAG